MKACTFANQLLLGSVLAVLFTAQTHAVGWYVARFNNSAGNTDATSNAMAAAAPVASATLNLVDVVDPQDFNSGNFALNTPIPGNLPGGDDSYSISASGILTVHTTGNYVFRSFADDGSKITLNGRNVVSTGGACCANVDSAAIALTAGQRLTVSYSYGEGGGGSYGEISVSRDGGAFSLLGNGSLGGFSAHPDLSVSQSMLSNGGSKGVNAGLKGEYFAVSHANQNAASDAFFALNPTPTGTFISTSPNYNTGATNMSTHLGADSGSLTAGGANGTDNSTVRLTGFVLINAGDDFDPTQAGIQIKFRIPSDDNSRLKIGNMVIAENDGGHGFDDANTDNVDSLLSGTGNNAVGTQIVSFMNAGYYSLEAFYHNGNGGLGINIQSSIGTLNNATLATLPSSRLFQNTIPEPASLALLGMGGLALLRRRRAVAA